MKNWQHYEKVVERGPMPAFFAVFGLFLAIALIIGGTGYIAGWFTDAASTAKKEFSASAMLRKYEWFKDASAQLDKKRADISVYESRLKAASNSDDRVIAEQRMIWMTELAGIKASYNGLAAEYNSQMAKFNWAFANAGMLPEGAVDPLPREFKPYTTE